MCRGSIRAKPRLGEGSFALAACGQDADDFISFMNSHAQFIFHTPSVHRTEEDQRSLIV
jgi:hypothetical protein